MSVVEVENVGDVEEPKEKVSRTLRLVPAELPVPQLGDVSIGTPYGKALLGREEGDVVVVKLPRRTERLEIVKITDPD
jgi:transcription elongation GreA/GreB family factor